MSNRYYYSWFLTILIFDIFIFWYFRFSQIKQLFLNYTIQWCLGTVVTVVTKLLFSLFVFCLKVRIVFLFSLSLCSLSFVFCQANLSVIFICLCLVCFAFLLKFLKKCDNGYFAFRALRGAHFASPISSTHSTSKTIKENNMYVIITVFRGHRTMAEV